MRRLDFTLMLSVFYILFSGAVLAEVTHPENTNVVGGIFGGWIVCFNNDGAVASSNECDSSDVDEGGVILIDGNWKASGNSGINGCGTGVVSPVTSATCPFTATTIASCSTNSFVLVQTIKSGHFWAIKADATCGNIAAPDTKGLVPCLSTEAFDPINGCTPKPKNLNPPEVSVKNGYFKLDLTDDPSGLHCADSTHEGRMVLDSVNDIIYVCTQSGWSAH